MYVVFAEELEDVADIRPHTVASLEQAFAQIVCRCGYAYHFEPRSESGWALVLTDAERPDRNPDPVLSDYNKPDDAKHDLIAQAVDGRLRGHVAVHLRDFERRRNSARRQGEEAPQFARMA
jgi:hypothetical protein